MTAPGTPSRSRRGGFTLLEILIAMSLFTVIGLGGMGGVAARYLAVFLASLGRPIRLCLIDGDAFEPGNDARMVFTRYGNKAVVLRDELLERFGDSALTIVAIEEFVTAENARRLIDEGDRPSASPAWVNDPAWATAWNTRSLSQSIMGRRRYSAACAASPAEARKRSASSAAMQPVPAAVTAWRNTLSCTSPAANTPGMAVAVESGLVTM